MTIAKNPSASASSRRVLPSARAVTSRRSPNVTTGGLLPVLALVARRYRAGSERPPVPHGAHRQHDRS